MQMPYTSQSDFLEEVIFEEFKGTGNSEVVLSRKASERRVYPAVNIIRSGTRKEELLLHPDELQKIWLLRNAMSEMDEVKSLEFIYDKMKETKIKSLLENKIFQTIIYYGDTARVPYGSKDKNTIIRYSHEALEYFANYDIDILIVACNTASAYALSSLQKVSKIPIVGVIDSGILAVNSTIKNKNSNILVIGTNATIDSRLYEKGLKKEGFKNITSIATPLFVPLVEENILDGQIVNSTLDHYFKDLYDIDIVILGCTHFPLLKNKIKNYFGKDTTIIHSGDAIVQFLKDEYSCTKKYQKTNISFFASSNPTGLKNVANRWLDGVIF